MGSENDNQNFEVCIHKTLSTASITVKAPSKAIALRAVETTLETIFDELEFKEDSKYIFTCSISEAEA